MAKSINEKIGPFAAIEPERHLIKISGEMLRADLVPRSDDAPLQERKCRFNGVRCDTSTVLISHVFFRQMVDSLMLGVSYGIFVGREAIGNKHLYICAHVLSDVLCQRSALGVFRMEETEGAVPLAKANNYFFVGESCIPSPTAIFAANIGFVHFNCTVQHGLIYFLHSRTDTMAEIPRGLVRAFVLAPDGSLELQCANTLLSFAEQQYGDKPDRQREMGIVEDRSTGSSKLVLTADTFIASIFFQAGYSRIFTAWTDNRSEEHMSELQSIRH